MKSWVLRIARRCCKAYGVAGAEPRQLLPDFGGHAAAQLGLNGARMHRDRMYPFVLMPTVEFDGEQRIRGLRSAIGDELDVWRMLEIRIVQIDIRKAMSGG